MRPALLPYNISRHEPLAAFWWLSICRTVHIPNARLCRSRVCHKVCRGVSRCVEGVKVSRLDTLTIVRIYSCQGVEASVSRCRGIMSRIVSRCRGRGSVCSAKPRIGCSATAPRIMCSAAPRIVCRATPRFWKDQNFPFMVFWKDQNFPFGRAFWRLQPKY